MVIAIAASVFSFLHAIFGSPLPLDEGDRIVALMSYDAAATRPKHPSLHDFARWRDELRLVEEIGAFRTIERRLVIEDDSEELASTGRRGRAGVGRPDHRFRVPVDPGGAAHGAPAGRRR